MNRTEISSLLKTLDHKINIIVDPEIKDIQKRTALTLDLFDRISKKHEMLSLAELIKSKGYEKAVLSDTG